MDVIGNAYWGAVMTRLLDLTPDTYDEDSRTVDAVLSRGSPVKRFYGTEQLEISKAAIDVSRIESGGIPLLDSHRQDGIVSALGRVVRAWIEKGALLGTLKFNETPEGEKAEQMVARGEIGAVSIGYRVEPENWRITDAKGNVIDPERHRFDDDGLTFTATKWKLLEASLCAVPADTSAVMRNYDREFRTSPPKHVEDTLARMQVRHGIATGTTMLAWDRRHFAPSSAFASIFDRQRREVDVHPARPFFYG
jgi:HK97 family phage prohead protease